jgi:hypothetical protein
MVIETKIDDYRFFDFSSLPDNSIVFSVESFYGKELTQKDVDAVREILADMGKWENLVKGGLTLLSDLRIININQTELQTYDKPVGAELYDPEVHIASGSCNYLITVNFRLAVEERHKREERQVKIYHRLDNIPLITVEEISGQVCNIAKWKAFKKTLETIPLEFLHR